MSTQFASLRERLTETYRKAAADEGPTEEEIKKAFSTLAGAWDQVASSFSAAMSDPDTRAHLKRAASSFAAAVGATVSALGEELKRDSGFSNAPGDEAVEESGSGGGVVDGDCEPPPAEEGEL